MAKGPRTKVLRSDQIARLENFRVARRLSYPQLNAAIGGKGVFGWQVLQRAMNGQPVWDLNHRHIAEWIEQHLPAPTLADGKAAAAGERASQ